MAAASALPVHSLVAHGNDPARVASALLRGLPQRQVEARVCLREEYKRAAVVLPVEFGGQAGRLAKRSRDSDTTDPADKRAKRSAGPDDAALVAADEVRRASTAAVARIAGSRTRADSAKKTLGRAIADAAQGSFKSGAIRGGGDGFKAFCRAMTRAGIKALRRDGSDVVADTALLIAVAPEMVSAFFAKHGSFRA